jgi:hypothetical protein
MLHTCHMHVVGDASYEVRVDGASELRSDDVEFFRAAQS